MTNTYTHLKLSALFLGMMLFMNNVFSQTLVTDPCAEPAAAQWTIGSGCMPTTTAGLTHLFDPISCNTGAFDDGWAWYIGTGAQNTITFTPDAGFDATIHLFEVSDPAVCSVLELGCSDNAGAGGSESIVGGGTLGTLYYIRVQQVGSSGTMTGCLGIIDNPATCSDGIQNQGEAGVDCGAPCTAPCPPATSSSQSGCSADINTPVDTMTCSIVGTAYFSATVGLVDVVSTVKPPIPSPAPSCGSTNGNFGGAWVMYDPENGVSAASVNLTTAANADASIFVAFYQGNSCASMSQLACEELLTKSGQNFILNPVTVTGIDDSQTLYMFVFSAKTFSFQVQLQGFPAMAPNDDCADATPAGPEGGCNVGATGASFLPPSNYSASICDGGAWYSNENTVFYSFTPDTSTATLEVENIICNNGQSGLAQFGVWTSCAAMSLSPTTANGFLGCAVGNNPLTLTGLTAGQTYILAVDGNAGDLCKWGFDATGGIILLYVNLVSFEAKPVDKTVLLNWETEREKFVNDFTVQRSVDGIHFEDIHAKVSKNGFTQFSTIDQNPLPDVSYYRLKIADVDGQQSYSDVISVTREGFDQKDKLYIHNVYPQPTKGQLNLDLEVGEATSLNVKIVNTLGQVVLQETLSVTPKYYNKVALDLGGLGAGSYSLIIENKDTKEARLERIHIAR